MPAGTYSTVATDAVPTWDTGTNLILSTTTSTSAAASIKTYNQPGNSYAGMTYSSCAFNRFTNSQATLNPYYTDAYSISKKRAIAVHELGHLLGLAHTTGNVIMNTCAGCMWENNGFWSPRTDDKNGINAVYP